MHVSYNKLTDLTGLSYRTLKKRLEGLQPVGVGRTKANLWESIEALPLIYGRNGSKKEKHSLKDDILSFNSEKTRLAKEQADGQALKNAEKRRQLVPASEITETWGRITTTIKMQLLALPSRAHQRMKTASTEKEKLAILKEEVNSTLEGLADEK